MRLMKLKTKQFGKKSLAVFLAAIMCLSMIVPASAANPKATNVDYIKENGENVGIKSAVIDGIDYYDIFGGKKDDKSNNAQDLYEAVLHSYWNDRPVNSDGEYSSSGSKDTKKITALEYWVQMAYLILRDNKKFTQHNNDGSESDFNKYTGYAGNSSNSGSRSKGRADVVNDLTRKDSGNDGGSRAKDNTRWTGLKYADSLKTVRSEMAESIEYGINKSNMSAEKILNATNTERLSLINKDTDGGVMYSMVTAIFHTTSGGFEYKYNSYGIAFYDFELTPVTADNLDLVTALNGSGYSTIQEAYDANPRVSGVYFNQTSDPDPRVIYNNSAKSTSVNAGTSSTAGYSFTNTHTETEQFTFTEALGIDVKWNLAGKFELVVGADATFSMGFSFDFTAAQMFSKSNSESTTISESKTDSETVTESMDPYTLKKVEFGGGTLQEDLEYDIPMAVNYKVAIFAMTGMVYADGVATAYTGSSGYSHTDFVAIIGGTNGNARDDLTKRVSSSVSGYDQSLNQTYGYYKKFGSTSSTTDTVKSISWGNIYNNGKKAVSLSYGSDYMKNGKVLVNWLKNSTAMSTFGGTLEYKQNDARSVKIGSAMSLKPLAYVALNNAEQMTEKTVTVGNTLRTSNSTLGTNGFLKETNNGARLNYAPFDSSKGRWVLLNDSGGEVTPTRNGSTETSKGDIGTLTYNTLSGSIDFKGTTEGDALLKYKITDNVYNYVDTSGNAKTYTNQSDLENGGGTAFIYVKVTPDAAKVSSVKLTSTVDKNVNLNGNNSPLKIRVIDNKTGEEINVADSEISWELLYTLDDIFTMSDDGVVTANASATNYIRATYKGVTSDWIEVTFVAETA